MNQILLDLLYDIATARDLASVNVAAGMARERLLELAAAPSVPQPPK